MKEVDIQTKTFNQIGSRCAKKYIHWNSTISTLANRLDKFGNFELNDLKWDLKFLIIKL